MRADPEIFSGARVSSRPPLPWLLRLPGLFLTVILLLAYRGSEGNFAALFSADARGALGEFVSGFWPPAHSADFLGMMARPVAETVAIAFLGMSLALLLAVPLSVFAASPHVLVSSAERPSLSRRAAYGVARLLLNLMRSIPELIWALIFVRAVGMGPAAGILAIGVGYGGILGKVFAEIFESVPRGPVEGLASGGAPPLRAFLFGVVPSATPLLASYALYRFDCSLRASAVLGIVGAGGLGFQLELSMKMFAYDEVAAIVVILFALVASVDQLSQWFRGKLAKSKGVLPVGRRGLALRGAVIASWAATAVGAGAFLDLPLNDLFSPSTVISIGAFFSSMFPPDLDPAFLWSVLPALGETLAVSILGTAMAAVLGILLAYPAAIRLYESGCSLDGTAPGKAHLVLRRVGAWVSRAILNLGRTLPEMLWALVFIFALGLGPFPGALALAIHTAGVLGRLYGEALEEVPAGPLLAIRGYGARHFGAAMFAVLPQAFPQLVAYTLYRWEVNIRASTVLGVVGAGGLGKALHISLNLFHHHHTLTLILVIIALVTVVDAFSGWLRRRVQSAGGARAAVRHEVAGAVEAVVGDSRLLVLDLSLKGAQLFARHGESSLLQGDHLPLALDFGGDGDSIRCRARLAWRRDEQAGVFLGLAFEHMGWLDTWRLHRALSRRPKQATPFSAAPVDAG
ncbi:MAG: phosphonate ABC transporter, permease protein PhnE [Myxococcales bacterium]|nr:phosphonate ABC transporter, permease protein PhnE [Myxococcales bacterium]